MGGSFASGKSWLTRCMSVLYCPTIAPQTPKLLICLQIRYTKSMSALPKLLYVLPDLAYVAELLPTKKPFSYAIHNFRQINGEFLDDNEFIEANIGKLLDRLDVAEYIVVLPDYLFTDTIVNVRADSETKVRDYLKAQLLPGLEIDKTTHQIETFILTEFKGMYKVQLSALERSLITPLSRAMSQRGLTVQSIVSLSWSAKSIISLEPSISVLQMGDKLYLSQHYIGIDQTNFAPVVESTNIVETVKTLKGAEPSIQTVYVLASEVVAAELKDSLHDLVPVQQLATFSDTDTKMPSYVKQIIEAGMRSLTAPDYMVPKFALEKVSPAQVHAEAVGVDALTEVAETPAMSTNDKVSQDVFGEEVEPESETDLENATTLPKPGLAKTVLVETVSTTTLMSSAEDIDDADEMSDDVTETDKEDVPVRTVSQTFTIDSLEIDEPIKKDDLESKGSDSALPTTVTEPDKATDESDESEVALEQFVSHNDLAKKESPSETDSVDEKTVASDVKTAEQPTKKIIKNQTDEKNMVKLIFIGLASFFATVGVGIGLGLGIMMVSGKKPAAETTTIQPAVPSLAPSVAPTATAASGSATTSTSSAQIKRTEKILVVNATKISGYAGKTATKLKAAGFTTVQTGNAAGTYEKGTYVLMRTKNDALLASLVKATGVELKSADGIATEDAKSQYDAVIVLAE